MKKTLVLLASLLATSMAYAAPDSYLEEIMSDELFQDDRSANESSVTSPEVGDSIIDKYLEEIMSDELPVDVSDAGDSDVSAPEVGDTTVDKHLEAILSDSDERD